MMISAGHVGTPAPCDEITLTIDNVAWTCARVFVPEKVYLIDNAGTKAVLKLFEPKDITTAELLNPATTPAVGVTAAIGPPTSIAGMCNLMAINSGFAPKCAAPVLVVKKNNVVSTPGAGAAWAAITIAAGKNFHALIDEPCKEPTKWTAAQLKSAYSQILNTLASFETKAGAGNGCPDDLHWENVMVKWNDGANPDVTLIDIQLQKLGAKSCLSTAKGAGQGGHLTMCGILATMNKSDGSRTKFCVTDGGAAACKAMITSLHTYLCTSGGTSMGTADAASVGKSGVDAL